jgi:hypothetical protein
MRKLLCLLLGLLMVLSVLPASFAEETIEPEEPSSENTAEETIDAVSDQPEETIETIGVGTGDWSNGCGWWSQGQSIYYDMRQWGCLVVAQAKMLVMSGAASSNTSVFNPDIYYEWLLNNGYLNEMVLQNFNAPVVYAQQLGKQLVFEGPTYSGISDKIWANINADKYSIVKEQWGSGEYDTHWVLINNGASKELGYFRAFASYPDNHYMGTQDWTGDYLNNTTIVMTYSVPSAPVTPTFTFNEDNKKLEIGETYAQFGFYNVYANVPLSDITAIGCELYNAGGTVLASHEEEPYIVGGDHLVHYWLVDGSKDSADIRYTLIPGETYRIRTYVTYGGKSIITTTGRSQPFIVPARLPSIRTEEAFLKRAKPSKSETCTEPCRRRRAPAIRLPDGTQKRPAAAR